MDRFLNGTLDFPGIAELCADAVDRFGDGEPPSRKLDELISPGRRGPRLGRNRRPSWSVKDRICLISSASATA